MAMTITNRCVDCDMCEPECPNGAISFGESGYEIDPRFCTECNGHYAYPACESVCPIENCIIKDPENVETESELLAKMATIQPNPLS